MGESAACLARSFSQPSPTSREENKGDLQRALTASVSFGRFVSESLDWEKWSAFTSNRYIEEAEKYSKPGYVAEKKAYFEAHFKRRRAAALLEQQIAEEEVTSSDPVGETENANEPIVAAELTNHIEEEKEDIVAGGSSNKRRSLHISTRNHVSASTKTSTRASANIFKHYSAAETKRSVRRDGGLIPEAKAVEEKALPPTSHCTKPSNAFGNRARVATVPSSFTFKSEERAAKRREFSQTLQQKAKSKEIGKNQMHAKSQVGIRSRDKRFCATETTKGVDNPLRNITTKIQSEKPKIEERAAAAFKVQNIVRPPWRSSAKSDGAKGVLTAKNSRRAAKCLPKSENISPNIQL